MTVGVDCEDADLRLSEPRFGQDRLDFRERACE
jgi:hypothetical protein